MRIGWLVDQTNAPGGAELTQAEFRAAAPDTVEIVDCPAGHVQPNLDRYVIQNCVQYTAEDLQEIGDRPALKYWHDVGPHLQADVTGWLAKNARHVCCSPLQAEYMGIKAKCVPPPVDIDRFERAAKGVQDRSGAVCVGSWRNIGKSPQRALDFVRGNGGIDFYGGGPFAPAGSQEVAYEDMPALLARYATFVYLPSVLEPFGRVVAEAWASGLEIVTNGLVGARYWIEQNPQGLENAADDFWRLVLE